MTIVRLNMAARRNAVTARSRPASLIVLYHHRVTMGKPLDPARVIGTTTWGARSQR